MTSHGSLRIKAAGTGARPQAQDAAEENANQIRAQLRRFERRDWWLWVAACLLMLTLTLAVASFSVPGLPDNASAFLQLHQRLAANGLLGLVLLFVVYTSYQQFLIKRFRRELAEQAVEAARLEAARTRVEELLRLSEDRFVRAFHSSPDAMSISTLDEARYLEVNDAFLRMVGYEKQEVLGRTALELGLWVNLSQWAALLEALQEKGKLENAEFLFRTKAGGIRYGLQSVQVIEVGGGKCILSAIRDCTEQRMADEALRTSEERYRTSEQDLRSLLDSAPYGICRSDLETGRFVSVNPALARMLGYTYAEELLALDLATDVFGKPEDRIRLMEALRGRDRFHGLELHWKRKDNSQLLVRASGRIVRGGAGKEYFEVIAEDISERRVLDY